MPWKATNPLKERTKFVLEWERRWNEAEGGRLNLAELCRMFGVSRQSGYTWVERYRDANHDLAAVAAERSRRSSIPRPCETSPAQSRMCAIDSLRRGSVGLDRARSRARSRA